MSPPVESESPRPHSSVAMGTRAKEEAVAEPEDLRVDLRPARKRDYDYAERLYIETMRPLLTRLDAWEEEDALAKFRGHYRLENVSIITVNGRDAGFLQVEENAEGITLAQIHIEAPYRSRGIGTRLLGDLLSKSRAKSKPVSLSVVKHNPAQALYERLGFQTVAQDQTKLHMRYEPNHSDNVRT
jgi:ribosomal protein S18 acetylase RimI-like enzyme